LDRGELDKIIERSAATYSAATYEDRDRRDERRNRHDDLDDSDYGRRYGYKGQKRKSFLGDLFDF
jgi:Zn-finger nucleic acid-binding protein